MRQKQQLPQGWSRTSLKEITTSLGGGTPSKSDASFWTDGTIPWVSPKDMKSFHILSSEDLVTVAALNRLSLVPADSVLVVVRSGILSRTFPVGLSAMPATINQDMRAFVPMDGISSRFLAWQLVAREREILSSCSKHGTTVASIEGPALSAFPLVLAPSAEQTRIVAKLEELLSDLDAGVAELKAAQAKLAQYRQSLLKAAVEGALTADWRARRAALETDRPAQPGDAENRPRPAEFHASFAAGQRRRHETPPTGGCAVPENRSDGLETGAQLLARILTERRARWEARQLARFESQGKTPPKGWQSKYPEPVTPDTRDLPELPEGWVWATVDQLGDVQLGRQRSPDKLKGKSPTKYIRAANITERGIDFCNVFSMDFSERERETFALHAGDVLLTEASGSAEHVGRPTIWPEVDDLYCFQNTVLRFSPCGISSDFAYFSFLAMQKLGQFRKLSAGVGINHLSAGKFSKLPIALPPLAEQQELVRALRQEFEHCDHQATALERIRTQSTAQRQNLLKAAFSGQLVPQDPNDEPASVLLERIRMERSVRAEGVRSRSRRKEKA